MKHYLLLFFTLTLSLSAFSQNTYPPTIWNKGIISAQSAPEDSGVETLDMAVEPTNGSVYVALRCYSTCTFSNGQTITPTANGEVLVLAKYLWDGTLEWVKNMGFVGPLYEGARVCSANLDGVYVAGVLGVAQVNFGNGITLSRSCNIDCDEVFLVKYAPDGQTQWANKVYGGENRFFTASGVQTDHEGNVYLLGNYDGTSATFGSSSPFQNLPPDNFFVAKYEAASGDFKDATFPQSGSESANPRLLAVNGAGTTLVAGAFTGSLQLGGGVSLQVPAGGQGGYFVASLLPNGQAQWGRVLSSSDYMDLLGIDVDAEGHAYLALDAAEDVRLDNSNILDIAANYAGVVLKVSQNAFSVPVFIEYDTDDFAVMDVAVDHLGIVYTAGYASEPLEINNTVLSPDGCIDGLLTATNADGLFQWARMIGGTGCEAFPNLYYASCIAVDGAGFLHANGLYIEGFSEDGISHTNAGAFVAKFNTSIVGTDEPGTWGELSISPNPNNGAFHLVLAEMPAQNAQLSIYDLNGRVVHRQAIEGTQTDIRANLPAGAYVVMLQNGPRLERQKLMVQR